MHAITCKIRLLTEKSVRTIVSKRYYAEPRVKFYSEVNLCKNEDGYEINLDQRKLRTPLGKILHLPNETLAQAVAVEWNSQDLDIKSHTMPMTTLCNMAADNPTNATKETLTSSILHFLPTDTILYFSPEPPQIEELQNEQWGEIIKWANNFYGINVVNTTGLYSPPISEETKTILTNYFLSYKFWPLIGFERMVNTLKSVLLSLALVERHITVEDAVSLSRLEMEFNISKWGNVEWYHDIELLETRSKVAASAVFIHACNELQKINEFRKQTS